MLYGLLWYGSCIHKFRVIGVLRGLSLESSRHCTLGSYGTHVGCQPQVDGGDIH